MSRLTLCSSLWCAAALLVLWTTATAAQACGTMWTWSNPSPQGNDLLWSAYDGLDYWAVGSHGACLRNSDGETWNRVDVELGMASEPWPFTR